MNIKQKITSGLAIGAMMAAVVAPASFATSTITIKNNGAWSSNHAKVKNMSSKTVVQTNETVVETGVGASAKTGGNSSSFNTGGTNTITTGKAKNTVGVSVTGGTNTNSGEDCGCAANPTTDVTIQGNGAFSHNGVYVMNSNTSTVMQSNGTSVETMVMTSASTGGNSSSFNTGGNSSIDTGNASNTVAVEVGGSSNSN